MQPNHRIFRGIPQEKLQQLLPILQIQTREYPKGSLLLLQGEENKNICILKKGKAHAVGYTQEGREVDYMSLKDGDLFGNELTLSLGQRSPVSIYADCDCTVIYFSYQALLTSEHPCACLLLRNLAKELSEKFFDLQRRIHYLTQPTLREKLLAYLQDCRSRSESDTFTISLDRNALASFLYCDRSALSRELSKLQKEGLLTFRKNTFHFTNSK